MSKSKFKRHEAYAIHPAQKLDEDTSLAFTGAQYHLNKFKNILESPSLLTDFLDGSQVHPMDFECNQLHWHLRGFLWEMVATFDTMLQCVNQKYELGLSAEDVKWKNIPMRAGKNQHEWNKKYALLKSAYESEWFFEVRAYRNYAHWAFNFFQVAYSEHKEVESVIRKMHAAKLLPVREGQTYLQPIEQLTNYWLEMQKLGKELFTS